MASRSYSNLVELASGAEPPPSPLGGLRPRLPRLVSDAAAEHPASPSPRLRPRTIVVANHIPVRAHRDSSAAAGWSFSWDDESLLSHLSSNAGEMEFLYVGCLRADDDEVPAAQHDAVAQALHDDFGCVPVFLPPELAARHYHGFCKQYLWPLFHYMLPLSPELGGRFDRHLWQAYVSANKAFADRILEVIDPDDDFVWVHDYHLMALPTLLRRRFNRAKLGFFLHSPFPSSEIYKTLPVREELLRSMLNSDLVGFHTFDYARHFLSCCRRMLGLSYESRRGYVGLEYYGRTVTIKILPVGVHLGQLRSVLAMPQTASKVLELSRRFLDNGKVVLLGVDDMDIFKGISLKLLAMEELLRQHAEWRGKAVLVQVANPARGRGRDVAELQAEAGAMAARINAEYGSPGYDPVVLLVDRPLQLYERVAWYAVAEVCLVTAVRDGMNLIPYEYIISRQISPSERKKSMLVVSEFIGCSPSLSGAIRVNPWNVESVADAMDCALTMPEPEKELRHEKHHRYVSTHDVGYWTNSFLQDLERSCREHDRRRCWGIGFGLKFRVVALDLSFRKLSMEHIVTAYRRTRTRAILLDYDGTLMPQAPAIDKSPTADALRILNSLCRDERNTVFLVSARSTAALAAWFASCGELSMAAEHGYFLRMKGEMEWEAAGPPAAECGGWKQIAEPVMRVYTETTDGSAVEETTTALVWRYDDADPDFGSCQAKELLDHLESVLANEPVSVRSGQHIVEVKPQGVSKGIVAQRLLASMEEKGMSPDFVLCIGDDRGDEDMFEVIMSAAAKGASLAAAAAEVFACTVGRKPSKAKYYLDDTADIVRLLQGLAAVSDRSLAISAP